MNTSYLRAFCSWLGGCRLRNSFGGQTETDHLDPDGNRLINVTTVEQLNAIRYDLDGNGYADESSDDDAYGNAEGTGGLFNITGRSRGYVGYELMNNLDLSTSPWAEGVSSSGWVPIGGEFTAAFEGNGFTISDLFIENSNTSYFNAGLFALLGDDAIIQNLGMLDVNITGRAMNSGSIAGRTYGSTIRGSYATGSVSVSSSSVSSLAGGLVGYSNGTLSNSHASVTISVSSSSVTFRAGGLVGRNEEGTISNSYATGDVSVSTTDHFSVAGGLVGLNRGTISNSCATGNASASTTDRNSTSVAGGLVGRNEWGTISDSYATGGALASSYAGGLVGYTTSGMINNCYATGDVPLHPSFFADRAGGLVGANGGTISNSYATGAVHGWRCGGLVGGNNATIRGSYATGSVPSSGASLVWSNGSTGSMAACYATGSTGVGLVIDNAGEIVACYAVHHPIIGSAIPSITNTGTVTESYYSSRSGLDGATEALDMVGATDYGADGALYPESVWNLDLDNEEGDNDLTTGPDDPWDFGTSAQYPVLKTIDVNQDGVLDDTDLALQRTAFAPMFLQDGYTFERPIIPDTPVVGIVRANAASAPLTYEATPSKFIISSEDEASFAAKVGVIRAAEGASLTIGEEVELLVRVHDADGGADEVVVCITVVASRPAAPVLTATLTDSGAAIALSWPEPRDGGDPISGYILEHATDGSTFMSLSDYDGTALHYTHTDLEPGSTHHYQVAATNSIGTGMYSEVQMATTYRAPDAPLNFRATTNGPEQVDLSWAAPNNDGGTVIVGYMVCASEDGLAFTELDTVEGAILAYAHTNLEPEKIYYYRLAAVNSVGNSAYATATTAILALTPSRLDFDSAGDTVSVSITSNLNWTAARSDDWIAIEGGSTLTADNDRTVRIQVLPNTSIGARTGTVTIRGGVLERSLTITQGGHEVLEIAPMQLICGVEGGEKTVSITSNLAWTATRSDDWILIEGGRVLTADNDRAVRIQVLPDPSTRGRTGTVTIRGGALEKILTITQGAGEEAAGEVLEVVPIRLVCSAEGGEKAVSITSNLNWTATSSNNWILIEGESELTATNNRAVGVQVLTNTSISARTGTVTIRGGALERIVIVRQEAADEALEITPIHLVCSAEGGEKIVAITSNLNWRATSSNDWITIEGGSALTADNDRAVRVQVLPNTATSARTGTVTIQGGGLGRILAITQEATGEVLEIAPAHLVCTADGGEKVVSITSNLTWTATRSDDWILVESGSTLTADNDRTMRIQVLPNTAISGRTGTVIIRGGALERVLAITQGAGDEEATGEVLEIVPIHLICGAEGGEKVVSIASNLNWRATSSDDWITIEGGRELTADNDRAVRVQVLTNTSTGGRTGTVTIRGGALERIVIVRQEAADEVLEITPIHLACSAEGGEKTVSITSNLSWRATSSNDWITIEGGSALTADNDRAVRVQVLPNISISGRTGTVTIQGGGLGRILAITQEATDEILEIVPIHLVCAAEGGEKAVSITSNLTWTTRSNDAWVTIEGGREHTAANDRIVRIQVLTNASVSARTGTVTIRGGAVERTLTVTQEAAPPHLSLSHTSLGYPALSAEPRGVVVESNVGWTAEVALEAASWLSVEGGSSFSGTGGGGFVVAVEDNGLTTARTGTIEIAGAGIGSQILVVTQAAPADEPIVEVEGIHFGVLGPEVGAGNFGEHQTITLHPNPTPGTVHITGLAPALGYRCSVYTLSGDPVFRGDLPDSRRVVLAHLPAGQYVFVLENRTDAVLLRAPLLLLR